MIKTIPYLFLFLQLIVSEFVLLIKIPKRGYWWIRFPAAVAVGGTASYFLVYAAGLGWFIFLIPLLLSIAAVWLCWRLNVLHSIVFGVVSYALQNCAFSVSQLILEFFPPVPMIAMELTALGVLAVLLVACFFLFARKPNLQTVLGKTNIPIVAVSCAVLVLITFLHSYFRTDTALTIGRVYLVCCVLLAVCLIFGISAQSRLSREKAEIEELLKKEENLHRLSKESIDLINMKCHDLRHRIIALRSERSSAALDEEIREMEEAIAMYDSFVKTGNDDLDIVIAEKSLTCKKYGIQLSCIIDGRKLDFMAPGDIYSLFGNALDNAIESLRSVPAEKRVISVSVRQKGNYIGICVENYCDKKPEFRKGLPLSDKKDKDWHGFGMKSMKYIAEKYGGRLLAELKGDLFVLNVAFPVSRAGTAQIA